MKHLTPLLLLFTGIIFCIPATAQDKQPVQFTFLAQRDAAGKANIIITAKVSDGAKLLSVKKQQADDVFVSAVGFDSTSSKFLQDSLLEQGNVQKAADAAAGGATIAYFADSVTWIQQLSITLNDSAVIKGSVTWLAKQGDSFVNGEEPFSVFVEPISATAISNSQPVNQESSIWNIFFICLVTGLLAVLTPCVFPLVPVTVSFFLKRSKSRTEGIRNAVWYSLSIILIYTIPTLLLTLAFGDKALYTLSTHPVTNLLFFAIFILFAISFFGAFEIGLPNSWANKADEKAGKGGFSGIFFMALTLVIVSFSCTGPIVGTLLGQTSTKGVSLAPVLGMLGFGVGLALPFSLFAFFPSMLQSLPKSGGWLNTVKSNLWIY